MKLGRLYSGSATPFEIRLKSVNEGGGHLLILVGTFGRGCVCCDFHQIGLVWLHRGFTNRAESNTVRPQ